LHCIYLRHAHLISVQSRWPSLRACSKTKYTPTRSIAYVCCCFCCRFCLCGCGWRFSIPVSKPAAASFNFYWDYLLRLRWLRRLRRCCRWRWRWLQLSGSSLLGPSSSTRPSSSCHVHLVCVIVTQKPTKKYVEISWLHRNQIRNLSWSRQSAAPR